MVANFRQKQSLVVGPWLRAGLGLLAVWAAQAVGQPSGAAPDAPPQELHPLAMERFHPGAKFVPALNCPATPPATAQDAASVAEVATTPSKTEKNVPSAAKPTDYLIEASAVDVTAMSLVDLRSEIEARDLRVIGALSIDRAAIETRQFLKQRDVVLVDREALLEQNLALAASLQGQGFRSVRVIARGTRGWLAAGLPVHANAGAIQKMVRLAPLELSEWFSRGDTQFVWVGEAGRLPPELAGATIITLPERVSPSARQPSALTAPLAKLMQTSDKLLVLIPQDTKVSAQLETLGWFSDELSAQHGYRLMMAPAGWAGYQRFVSQQHAMLAQKSASLERPCSAQ